MDLKTEAQLRQELATCWQVIEQAKDYQVKLEQQLATAKETDLLLRNLLCVIHRDGGHHITAHGLDQSVQDAMEVFYNLRDMPEQLAAALAACEAKDEALFFSSVSSCTCLTKTPEVAQHAENCRYRRNAEALAIKPDASALKEHDAELIERCADKLAICLAKDEPWEPAIRELKAEL